MSYLLQQHAEFADADADADAHGRHPNSVQVGWPRQTPGGARNRWSTATRRSLTFYRISFFSFLVKTFCHFSCDGKKKNMAFRSRVRSSSTGHGRGAAKPPAAAVLNAASRRWSSALWCLNMRCLSFSDVSLAACTVRLNCSMYQNSEDDSEHADDLAPLILWSFFQQNYRRFRMQHRPLARPLSWSTWTT